MLRRSVLIGSKCIGRNAVKNPTIGRSQVRRGHGHAKDAHTHSNEPYAIKHHDHYPDEAYAFGIKPGDAAEGWEYMTYGVYAACTLVLVIGLNSGSNGDFKVMKPTRQQSYLYHTNSLFLNCVTPYQTKPSLTYISTRNL